MKRFIFLIFCCHAIGYGQNLNYATNTAVASGNWNSTTVNSPWNSALLDCNYKIINNGVTVTQNVGTVTSNTITFVGNGQINLASTNKIILISESTPMSCAASGYVDKITVDFGDDKEVNSMTGFLQGLGFGNNTNYLPVRDSIEKLQPKLFRQVRMSKYPESYNLSGEGRVHMVTNGEWSESNLESGTWGGNWGERPPNFDNWESYEESLETVFDWGYNGGNPLPGIIWECWNEPDTRAGWDSSDDSEDTWTSACSNLSCLGNQSVDYWPTTFKQNFFTTYKKFYTKLRTKLGAYAKCAGPSLGYFNEVYLKEFFDYCLENELEVNVVTWHEVSGPERAKPFTVLTEHVDYVRNNFMNNPHYEDLKIQSIEINETVPPYDKNNPAAIVAHLGYLENAGVDYACKSCWNHVLSTSPSVKSLVSCYDNSLNDLFTVSYQMDGDDYIVVGDVATIVDNPLSPNLPKSSWWAYKLYSDGVQYRVESENQQNRSVVLASRKVSYPGGPSTQYAQVLFGYNKIFPVASYLPNEGTYNIRLNNISSIINGSAGSYFKIRLNKIPYRDVLDVNYDFTSIDNEELTEPQYVTETVHYKDGQGGVNYVFSEAEMECLYQMIITPISHTEYEEFYIGKTKPTQTNLISPNPSKGIFNTNSNSEYDGLTTVEIFTIMGEKIMEEKADISNGYQVDLTNQPTGVYLIVFTNKEKKVTRKIIKK